MRRLFKIFSVAFATMMLCICFVACGEENGPFTVTFDANLEGTGLTQNDVTAVKDQTVEKGEKAKSATIVIKTANPEGYAFQYWMTEKTGSEAYDFETPVTSDLTLYAKWAKQLTVTFKGFENDVEQKVFSGGKAVREDAAAGWTHVDGYFTDEARTLPYDFNTPVTSDLTLYVKTSGKALYADAIMGLGTSYGNSQKKFDPDSYTALGFSKAEAKEMAADETKLTLVGDNYEDKYVRVHFGASENTAWIHSYTANMHLNTPILTGERDADKMTITYKNLGPCKTLRFYYVVGYYNEETSEWTHSGNGGWQAGMLIDTPVKSGMKETDEWATVTIDLVEGTKRADGYSEWGNAQMLLIPRWEFIDASLTEDNDAGRPKGRNPHLDNDVLLKSIVFHA